MAELARVLTLEFIARRAEYIAGLGAAQSHGDGDTGVPLTLG
jgi:hypothetical protein